MERGEAETGLFRSYYNDVEDFAGEVAIKFSNLLDRVEEAEGEIKDDSK